jgi:ATP-dependent Clp protease ATP-binding subunit ClpA
VTPHGELKPESRELVMGALQRHFRPEFLNRIDDIVLFKPLTSRRSSASSISCSTTSGPGSLTAG